MPRRPLVSSAFWALVCWLAAAPAWPLAQAGNGETSPDDPPPQPRPPASVTVQDVPNDNGNAVRIVWTASPDELSDSALSPVKGYQLSRRIHDEEGGANGPETTIAAVAGGVYEFLDSTVERGKPYVYRVRPLIAPGTPAEEFVESAPAQALQNWIRTDRIVFGILLAAVCGMILFFMAQARKGTPLKLREIAGLKAVDEAVGRAVEMGRPCLFSLGSQDINDIQVVAGLSLLSRVVRTAAEFGARVIVPTSRSLVMTAAREAVQSAYLAAGRPDEYDEDQVYYLTDEQFGYVAAVTGTMMRDRPAACFYFGPFYAESLIFAETGNSIGAIQIAGTAEPAQLPFFVAACDYALLGEEFFAASAYLSGEPQQLGSVKGQDYAKLMVAALLLVGCALSTFAQFDNRAQGWLAAYQKTVLGREAD